MNWKKELNQLEQKKKWNEAIEFLQKVIEKDHEDMDAYIFMNYLLMNLLVEETYDQNKEAYYEKLEKWYFEESYEKFKDDPEYLYLVGRTAGIAEWYFGIKTHEYKAMMEKAAKLDPDNLIYQQFYYWKIEKDNPADPRLITYAKIVLHNKDKIIEQLKDKGAVGQYVLNKLLYWYSCVIENAIEKNEIVEK